MVCGARDGNQDALLSAGPERTVDSADGTWQDATMSAGPRTEELTQLLNAASEGDGDAAARAWRAIYDDVRAMAARSCAHDAPRALLQPTLVVHELFLKMFGPEVAQARWDDRRHFWGSVARAMSQYLIDLARSEGAAKRGGGYGRVDLDIAAGELSDTTRALSSTAVDALEALDRLECISPETAQVARLRFLSGMSIEQTAAALDIAPRTVNKRWTFAQAWLRRALDEAA